MARQIASEKELHNLIENILKKALQEIANKTRDELKGNLMNDWYNRPDYKPNFEVYIRTMQLYDSITAEAVKKNNGGLSVNVFFDLNKIHPYLSDKGFNAHMSLNGMSDYMGHPIAWWLIRWIDQGVSPRLGATYIGNQPIQGIHMFDKTKAWLDAGNLDRIIKSVFSKYGFKLTKI